MGGGYEEQQRDLMAWFYREWMPAKQERINNYLAWLDKCNYKSSHSVICPHCAYWVKHNKVPDEATFGVHCVRTEFLLDDLPKSTWVYTCPACGTIFKPPKARGFIIGPDGWSWD